MKAMLALFAFFMMSTAPVFAAEKHGHDHKPLHGGIVVDTKDADYELVAKPDMLRFYMRDHGKPADLGKASAKVTILIGAEKQEIELKPAGSHLEAKGQFKTTAGAKVLVQLNNGGKSSAVRFVLK